MTSILRLKQEYEEYVKEPNCMYSIELNNNNFYNWNVLIFGPMGTIFEGGIFKCNILFSQNYPNEAPKITFVTKLPHPNIYTNGTICISILHNGVDEFGYENINERWNPSHSVNSILLSIISILNEPNLDSPANIDIALLWKNNIEEYKKIVYDIISNTI